MKLESSDSKLNVALVLIQTRALGLRHKMKQACSLMGLHLFNGQVAHRVAKHVPLALRHLAVPSLSLLSREWKSLPRALSLVAPMSSDCQVRIIVLETQVNKTVPLLASLGTQCACRVFAYVAWSL